MQYVIGVDGGLTRCVVKAKDMRGNTVAERQGGSVHSWSVSVKKAERSVSELIEALLGDFGGNRENCKCIVVGASGLDSTKDLFVMERLYGALGFPCPVFCMNDGMVALYGATKGLGAVAISGAGSIVVGRNSAGKITRSGGYPVTIMGDEGSAQWIALMALRHMSKWVDESVPQSALVNNMIEYFHGFDSNKLIECAKNLRRNQVKPEMATLVYSAAEAGDEAAVAILRKGAGELMEVLHDVARKLDYTTQSAFLCGMWDSVFHDSPIFAEEFRRLLLREYPTATPVFQQVDSADSAAQMSLDYLAGKVPFIAEL